MNIMPSDIDLQYTDPSAEMSFLGLLYKHEEFLFTYLPVTDMTDFTDPMTQFFYRHAKHLYKNKVVTFSEAEIFNYMAKDDQRFNQYKEYGGYNTLQTWIDSVDKDNASYYFNTIKKYSVIRAFKNKGFYVDGIIKSKRFHEVHSIDIYNYFKNLVDKIYSNSAGDSKVHVLNYNVQSLIRSYITEPDFGCPIPFHELNNCFKGLTKGSVFAFGMISNAGKTRFMIALVAYIAFVQKQSVGVLLNEMTEKEVRTALITTVLNSKEFQDLHGIHMVKPEREITLGLYRDRTGKFIQRYTDIQGRFIESEQDYQIRLMEASEEYQNVIKIGEWIESEENPKIYIKDFTEKSETYSDSAITFEIRKMHLQKEVEYFFYDTLKEPLDSIGKWETMKITTTKLSHLAKELDIFIYGSIQLSDEALNLQPDKLNSSVIANCKQLKHLLDGLVLCKEIPVEMYSQYQIYHTQDLEAWGKQAPSPLNFKKRYYAFVMDKNRKGGKRALAISVNLDTNTWIEEGILGRINEKEPTTNTTRR